MTTEQFDLTVTAELNNFLRALKQGQEEGEGFSPTDTVAMALLSLKEHSEEITVPAVLSCIKKDIWPTIVHDMPMVYGDASFNRMAMTYAALIKPVAEAMRTDDPASALLRLHEQTNGKFAVDVDTWEE